MSVIHKVQLGIRESQDVDLPSVISPLCVQLQRGVPCLWYTAAVNAELIKRRVVMFGTGMVSNEIETACYLGTVQDGAFVWHFFLQS